MTPQAPQQGEIRTVSSRTTAISSDTPPAETQLQRRRQLVHHYAANAATENITLDTKLTSARCKSIPKRHTILTDTPVALTSASKYFQMLPAPPGALPSALRLYKSILMCYRKHLQLWRCIQDATRFEY